ncbi:hypothetical protein KDW_41410 [Dictyobacter vulcani]|uniref:RHS repeat-associated core domain-containing protein n=1 Tax=Dictyobacter vulcani TaxID=2607529 RepID=A0A5J4KV58_9CHLR|nr:RHS repeat-associated core domain-containing protein [Dictyobacter vulcani]GER89979.1 hypothetical protein KDW_41410 [Dictyobacter vulcani]
MTTPYNYTGQRRDSTSGLLYYGARYYDATSGRFTSADTVETNGTGLDAYAYVKGSPETFTDPTGHGRCGPDGDCVGVPGPGTPGQPPAPEPTQPGVGGGDDACHNMALCGGGGGSSGGGASTGGDGQCHSGCKAETTGGVVDTHVDLVLMHKVIHVSLTLTIHKRKIKQELIS